MIFSEAKAAVDLVKDLAAYLQKKGEYDPQLMGMFSDLQSKVLGLWQSDIELRQQIQELRDKLNTRDDAFFDRKKGAYYTGTLETPKDGPFCGNCYFSKGLVPMAESVNSEFDDYGLETFYNIWRCPVCKNKIKR